MKRLVFAGLAALALVVAAPAIGEAQVRVSVNVGLGPRYGHRYGHTERVYRYTPRVYYGGYHYGYRNSYRGYYRPRVEVVRVYRPAPVVVIHRNHHRGYRSRRYRY